MARARQGSTEQGATESQPAAGLVTEPPTPADQVMADLRDRIAELDLQLEQAMGQLEQAAEGEAFLRGHVAELEVQITRLTADRSETDHAQNRDRSHATVAPRGGLPMSATKPPPGAVTNGAELVRRLKQGHTPDGPLAHARAVLRQVREEDGRVATAAEVIAGLAEALGDDHGTVSKARALAETGDLPQPAPASAPIEDELLDE